MPDTRATLLNILQHADSMFPAGTVSFSWGLEALCNRGQVLNRSQLEDFAIAQLKGRWATLDRVMMVHAHRAGPDPERLSLLDSLIEAQSLSREQRMGSSRMGAAFLSTHCKLGTSGADMFAKLVGAGRAHGHLPVIQGMIWRGLGFEESQIQPMAAHGLCTAFMGAAVRLSVIGHVDAQWIHSRLLPEIESILVEPVGPPEEAHSFIPQIDIASMAHETDEMRLFIN